MQSGSGSGKFPRWTLYLSFQLCDEEANHLGRPRRLTPLMACVYLLFQERGEGSRASFIYQPPPWTAPRGMLGFLGRDLVDAGKLDQVPCEVLTGPEDDRARPRTHCPVPRLIDDDPGGAAGISILALDLPLRRRLLDRDLLAPRNLKHLVGIEVLTRTEDDRRRADRHRDLLGLIHNEARRTGIGNFVYLGSRLRFVLPTIRLLV
jgi:hypothetical protein